MRGLASVRSDGSSAGIIDRRMDRGDQALSPSVASCARSKPPTGAARLARLAYSVWPARRRGVSMARLVPLRQDCGTFLPYGPLTDACMASDLGALGEIRTPTF